MAWVLLGAIPVRGGMQRYLCADEEPLEPEEGG